MERGTLLVGDLIGFALSTVTFVVLGEPPATVPDPRAHDKLNHIIELLERIERRETPAPIVAQSTPERRPVLADQSGDVTHAQLLAEVRAVRDALERHRRDSEVVPATMNVGEVLAAIELGRADLRKLRSSLGIMSRRQALRRFGRPTRIWQSNWTYEPGGGRQLTLVVVEDLVTEVAVR